MVNGWELLLHNHLGELFGKHRDDLVNITYYTYIGDTEDRSELVLVDGDDEITLFHTCKVLDGTGDTASHVEGRTDGLTGLWNLNLVRHYAGVYHST